MSRIKGGRKRSDKKIGRGHWQLRKMQRASQLAGGRSNDASGKEISVSDLKESWMRNWGAREQMVAQRRQERNQSARRRRGTVTGPITKPCLPGRTPGTWHA